MLAKTIIIFSFCFFMSFDLCASIQVTKHPDPTLSLMTRWNWAVQIAGNSKINDSFWIGYTIKRLMGEDDSIGHFDDDHAGPTLMEIITGVPPARPAKTVGEEAERILNEMEHPPEKKVWKDVAVLFQFHMPSKSVSRISISNMDLAFSFKKLPIFWLGSAENPQSIEFLKTLYSSTTAVKRREELIAAIAIHQSPDLVVPFLKDTVTGQEDSQLRKTAVFWLGQTQEPAALKFLLSILNRADTVDLQKPAVFSISQMRFMEAHRALLELAMEKDNREVRMEAIFWVAQQGSDQAPSTLESIAMQDSDPEAQQKAVFALSQLQNRRGIPILTRIASNHKKMSVREEAIFWIGQTGGKSEADILEKVAFQDPDRGVRKKAIFSISQMKKDLSIPHLERIAKTHPEMEMRKESIFWLGQMKDPAAKKVLLQILR